MLCFILLRFYSKGRNLKDSRYLFIVNPAAGQGRTAGLFGSIKPLLDGRKIPFEFRLTSGPGEAESFAREALSGGFTHIVAVGGDGTSHEVVNGILGSSIIFGAIPSGSGNDFPKSAGIPLETGEALETLFSGRVRTVDVGKLGDAYFINGLGIGLDGAVSHRFKKLKHFRGQLGYILGAVQEALSLRGLPGGDRYRGLEVLGQASSGRRIERDISGRQVQARAVGQGGRRAPGLPYYKGYAARSRD